MPDRPAIGIAASSGSDAQAFADVVRRSSGIPWTVPTGHSISPEDALDRVDGLLIARGPNRSPRGSGDPWRPNGTPESEIDLECFDARLLAMAMEKDMPVLGVGVGMLSLNLSLGGAAAGYVSGHGMDDESAEAPSSYHHIFISPGTRLAAIVGSGGFVRVNSRHRRGIKDAQKSPILLASAYSLEDGVIEALESPDHDWVIAVHFQPERRLEIPPHFDHLFLGLVEHAGLSRSI